MAGHPHAKECRCDQCVVEKADRRLAAAVVARLALTGCIEDTGLAEQRALTETCRVLLECGEPPLWHVAVTECTDAHQALDHAKVPQRTGVPRRVGDGRHEITMGLAQRIQWLVANRPRP